jgi:hypothetical protein
MDKQKVEELVLDMEAKRSARLAIEKQADALKKQEDQIRASLVELFRLHNQSEVMELSDGRGVYITQERKYVVKDWPTVYAYIKEHGCPDILQKRLTDSQVDVRGTIPGVISEFPYKLMIAGS